MTPPQIVELLLRTAGSTLVLVGGQALAFWMSRYAVAMPSDVPYVSRDVDFLARSRADVAEVRRLAQALGGRTILPRERDLTALVGQAVKVISDDEHINVDVIFRVFGAEGDVASRAVKAQYRDFDFRVMHPADVLKSRLDNLHKLGEKQNALGEAQLRAAIAVMRAFLLDTLRREPKVRGRRPATLEFAGFLERLATGSAGRKIARLYTIHVADAVEPAAFPSEAFLSRKLPQLARLMSDERRAELGFDTA